MNNHFHGVIETPLGNLVDGMKWLLGTYTSRFNRRHRLSGHLFSGRYKALIVQGNDGYLRTACDYVHLNPKRAKLLKAEEPLRAYAWSSYRQYLSAPKQRASWIRVDTGSLASWAFPRTVSRVDANCWNNGRQAAAIPPKQR